MTRHDKLMVMTATTKDGVECTYHLDGAEEREIPVNVVLVQFGLRIHCRLLGQNADNVIDVGQQCRQLKTCFCGCMKQAAARATG